MGPKSVLDLIIRNRLTLRYLNWKINLHNFFDIRFFFIYRLIEISLFDA